MKLTLPPSSPCTIPDERALNGGFDGDLCRRQQTQPKDRRRRREKIGAKRR
ncbi:uncharacterized protein G2W53_044421 [Senna tora]|uniref:Uncharacterized protein n=1 Tax=Senna tora TaxID=362788 RepID=A0A834VXV1_9FABA|nr:uncharacterized protein G2W53_044421 [Senna tora]